MDTNVLALATRGVYAANRVAGVPAALRERYLLRGRGPSEGLVRVRPEVTRLVTFRRINLRDEASAGRAAVDAVLLRDVPSFLDHAPQRRVGPRLGRHLQ